MPAAAVAAGLTGFDLGSDLDAYNAANRVSETLFTLILRHADATRSPRAVSPDEVQ